MKNTTMSTLHIRLILLPSPEAHARVLAKLMTACHSHRLQRFCERHGASVPHFVVDKMQFCEGAVCLGILEKWKHQSQRANDCIPSRRSRAEPRQFLHIRMSVKRHAVPDSVVSSHVKSCLTGHCPATRTLAMEIVRRALNNNPNVLRRLQQCNCNNTLIAAISKI